MTVVRVRVPHFALRVALLDRPELDGAPLILSAPRGGRMIVIDASPEAAHRGIRPGQTPREAGGFCPEAVTLLPNPVHEAAVAEEIALGLEALSPLVEPDPDEPGDCTVDLRGLERRLGPPAAAAAALLRVVPPALRPRAGVAPGKFTARVAAGQAPPGGVRVVAPDEVRAFLADIPVSWLPLPRETIPRLERLGLRTLGHLAALPGSAVAARFGPAGRHAWDLAQGRDDPVVRPRERETSVVVALTMPAATPSRDMLLVGVKALVARAFARPELHGRHVRQVWLRVLIEDGRSWDKRMTLGSPVGMAGVWEALRHRLAAIELPGAAEALILEISGLTAEADQQVSLPGIGPRARRTRPLVEAARQLKHRYGASPIYHIVEVEPWSRIPERRHALISYDP